ncbi:MAG: mechanosensitive ion channel [Gemmatimonadota bacterium]|nr:mechanosensitive ion channel [Gemmatimonadota bacterium]
MQAPQEDSAALDGLAQEAAVTVRGLLDTHLFTMGNQDVTVSNILAALLVMLAGFFLSQASRRVVRGIFRARRVYDEGLIGTAQRLVRYTILVLVIFLALDQIGIDLSTLFAAGAIAAVAIGFALQNILQNFVAGIILLVERSITPLDVLNVDGQIVRVVDMRIRSTIVRTLDEEEIIIPNAQLVQSSVKNYTLRDPLYRLRTQVGVSYSSDVDQVFKVLMDAATTIPNQDTKRTPVVLFTEFGDSALNFDVSIWVRDPWLTRRTRSELNHSIWRHLKEAGIVVAFPQLDIHFDPPGHPNAPPAPRALG